MAETKMHQMKTCSMPRELPSYDRRLSQVLEPCIIWEGNADVNRRKTGKLVYSLIHHVIIIDAHGTETFQQGLTRSAMHVN